MLITTKPIFCIVLADAGEKWIVEAEWPDGTIEQIDAFGDHRAAAIWVSDSSEIWLK